MVAYSQADIDELVAVADRARKNTIAAHLSLGTAERLYRAALARQAVATAALSKARVEFARQNARAA